MKTIALLTYRQQMTVSYVHKVHDAGLVLLSRWGNFRIDEVSMCKGYHLSFRV